MRTRCYHSAFGMQQANLQQNSAACHIRKSEHVPLFIHTYTCACAHWQFHKYTSIHIYLATLAHIFDISYFLASLSFCRQFTNYSRATVRWWQQPLCRCYSCIMQAGHKRPCRVHHGRAILCGMWWCHLFTASCTWSNRGTSVSAYACVYACMCVCVDNATVKYVRVCKWMASAQIWANRMRNKNSNMLKYARKSGKWWIQTYAFWCKEFV